ncbi:MAG: hypothetical protein QXZ39_01975 [Desulfurococcaceae archaeon]|uniref:Uncharacterized protein n=1 Tax=Staphylothermus marinus TaxID=2280 RepID=A0A7C4HDD0_STAMA
MKNDEIVIFKIDVPEIDIEINDPFSIKIEDIRISLPLLPIEVKASLPQIIPVDIPVISRDELFQLVNPDLIRYGKSSFDDVIAVVPIITTPLASYEESVKEKLVDTIKSIQSRRIAIKTELTGLEINIPTYQIIDFPQEIRDRHTLKIKFTNKTLTPEIREFIEERLTKEFKITRIVKKMEIIDNESNLTELEFVMKDFLKKIKRYRSSHKAL